MPTYVYKAIAAEASCPACIGGFDVLMRMTEPPLESCPECGQPIRRVISPTNVNKQAMGEKISDRRLGDLGFTKLVKDDDGRYKKTVGGENLPDIPSIK